MEVKPQDLPLRLPLTEKPVVHGGVEYQLEFTDLAKELRSRVKDIDKESVLVQVNINDTGIGFVFEEVL
jgi:hypothetical protein